MPREREKGANGATADREKRRVFFDVEVRSVDDGEEKGTFTGYASVFGVIDSYGTVFDKGCFKKTLRDNKGEFPLCWMHDVWEPIGICAATEDDKGLWIEGRLNLETQRGAEVYSNMKMRAITQMSHSFRVVSVKNEEADDKSKIPHFKEVRLYEISPVTRNYAANEDAEIDDVRSRQDADETDEEEEGRAIEGLDDFEQQLERFRTLFSEPANATRTGEPSSQAGGDHLRAFEKAGARLETVLTGGENNAR